MKKSIVYLSLLSFTAGTAGLFTAAGLLFFPAPSALAKETASERIQNKTDDAAKKTRKTARKASKKTRKAKNKAGTAAKGAGEDVRTWGENAGDDVKTEAKKGKRKVD